MSNEPLTVLTYNVFNHHAGDATFANRLDALVSVVAKVNPDVVCIQEAPSTDFLRLLAAHLTDQQQRYMRVACTEMQRSDGWTEHIGIIHPGTMRTATLHPAPTGERIGISVHLAGTNLTVVCVHLNPHQSETRHAQAATILSELPTQGAVLLCGDLNAAPRGGTLSVLGAELEPLAPDQSTKSTFPTPLRSDLAGHPGAILDHILGRDVVLDDWGLAGNEPVGGIWPSDHMGIWARVRLAS